MNIGIFLGNFNPDLGGQYTFQNRLISSLETAETSHNFFIFYSGVTKCEESAKKIKYVSLSGNCGRIAKLVRRGLHLLKGKKSEVADMLQKAIDRYRIDMIWFVTHRFELVDIPYICTVLDLEHRVHPFFPEVSITGNNWENRERSFSTMIPRAAYVISGTEAGKQQIIDFYHPDAERVKVIPFPVSQFAIEQKEITEEVLVKHSIDKPYLFYPAQFWPHKNHIVLLHVLKLLRDKHRLDMDIVFCGSDKGNSSYVKETALELGLENHVRFLGFVPTEELYALYKNAFALAFPSVFGPDNLPPIEAFAIGCPVIAANVAGAGEQLGDAALLIDPLHEEEIAHAVMRLHEEPELRLVLIKNGKERVKQLTPHNYIRGIVAICDDFELYRRCWSRKEKYIHS